MRIREIQCRSALTKSSLPEADFVLNPYVGCGHGCRYCYASFMRRFTGHGSERWGSFVDVRVNAPEVLARELRRRRQGSLLLGSVTDCYMPLESRYRVTRRCLEVLASNRGGLSVSVLTKGALVTRDIDLLCQLQANVGVTITSHEDSVARVFEPLASTASERIAALRELHLAGLATYVFVGPILPGLTDIGGVIAAVHGFVDSAMGEVLNFRGCASDCARLVERRFPHAMAAWQAAREDKLRFAEESRDLMVSACRKYNVELDGFYVH